MKRSALDSIIVVTIYHSKADADMKNQTIHHCSPQARYRNAFSSVSHNALSLATCKSSLVYGMPPSCTESSCNPNDSSCLVATIRAVLLVTGVCHATELVLSSELTTELPIRSYELLAHIDHHLARRDGAVSLDTDHHLGDVGMSHCTLSGTSLLCHWCEGVMDLPLYPAIRTWGACLRCSLRRLPRVWSSLSRMKSEVLDMPVWSLSVLIRSLKGGWVFPVVPYQQKASP